MVVQGDEDVLSIASCNTIPVFIDDKIIDKVGPLIDGTILGSPTANTDNPVPRFGLDLEPQFVGIHGALGQVMTYLESSNDGFQKISLSCLECGHLWTQRCDELSFERSSFADTKDIDPSAIFKNRLSLSNDLIVPSPEWQSGIASGEIVVVHNVLTSLWVRLGCKVVGLLVGHVAAIAVGLGLLGIVEASCTMPCHSA